MLTRQHVNTTWVLEVIPRLTNRTPKLDKAEELASQPTQPVTSSLTERVSVSVPKSGPGVYVAWLKNLALYIGFGANVWKRSQVRSGSDEHGKNRLQAFSEADRLEIFPCNSKSQAIQLETELIRLCNPKYNSVGHLQGSYNFQQLQAEHAKLFGGRRRKRVRP